MGVGVRANGRNVLLESHKEMISNPIQVNR